MHPDFPSQLAGARTFTMLRYPFYYALLQYFTFIEDESVSTACVNQASVIRINPKFFAALGGPAKRAFLLCHELLHPAFGYFKRSEGHDAETANAAHDYVINLILTADHKDWTIENILLDQRFLGMSYEEVYRILRKEEQPPPPPSGGGKGGKGKGKGAPGDQAAPQTPTRRFKGICIYDTDRTGEPPRGEDGQPLSPAEIEEIWIVRITQAAQLAKMHGKLPSHLEMIIDEMCQPKVTWIDYLKLFVAEQAHRTRTDWSTPNRRSAALDYYAPSEQPQGCDAAVYVDTSGSVCQDGMLEQAKAEVREIIRSAGGRVRWLCGDATVAKEEWLAEGDEFTFVGGGGTSFVPVFELLEANPPKLLVMITDAQGDHYKATPHYPVLWALYESAEKTPIPFGEKVVIPGL